MGEVSTFTKNNFDFILALILLINTAFEKATVSITGDDQIFLEAESNLQKDHSSFLEPAIKKLCDASGFSLNEMDAISVVNGPGSYTGLRVGLSSVKALCYALNKPLILLNSLDIMALALKRQSMDSDHTILFCPLIDARRMEVYTALYNFNLEIVKNYSSEIIDENFLATEKKSSNIVAGGSGSSKMQQIIQDDSVSYINPLHLSRPAAIMSQKAFDDKNFSDVAYSEPFYLKQVYFRK